MKQLDFKGELSVANVVLAGLVEFNFIEVIGGSLVTKGSSCKLREEDVTTSVEKDDGCRVVLNISRIIQVQSTSRGAGLWQSDGRLVQARAGSILIPQALIGNREESIRRHRGKLGAMNEGANRGAITSSIALLVSISNTITAMVGHTVRSAGIRSMIVVEVHTIITLFALLDNTITTDWNCSRVFWNTSNASCWLNLSPGRQSAMISLSATTVSSSHGASVPGTLFIGHGADLGVDKPLDSFGARWSGQ